MRSASVLLGALVVFASVFANGYSNIPASDLPAGTKSANVSYTVGISAGAFAAVQFHVSFSSTVQGAGVTAGGPFYCAKDSISEALTTCMRFPTSIDVSGLQGAMRACASGNVCDPLENLKDDKVWLYSGSNDQVVATGSVEAAGKVYEGFMPSTSIQSVIHEVDSAHGWVTLDYGRSCSSQGEPFIQKCDYDMSTKSLSWLTGKTLNAPGKPTDEMYYEIDQSKYTSGTSPASISMGPKAYVFVPPYCASNPGKCPLVIAFHGCEMTLADIGTDFVGYSGITATAVANNMMVLFPQVIRSQLSPSNPEGCFDWWGYAGSNYANQEGPQNAAVYRMAQALASGTA